jgi:hypothetical protein
MTLPFAGDYATPGFALLPVGKPEGRMPRPKTFALIYRLPGRRPVTTAVYAPVSKWKARLNKQYR